MKITLVGLCALSLFAGLTSKTTAQTVTVTVGPATDDSYWVWSDEYRCWVWNGPEFQGEYQGHPYSYWHGRHEGDGDRNHRPGKVESSEAERPVNGGDAGQQKVEQPKGEVEKEKVEQPKTEVEKPQVEEKSKGEEKSRPKVEEKPKAEEKAKAEKPKEEEKKDHL